MGVTEEERGKNVWKPNREVRMCRCLGSDTCEAVRSKSLIVQREREGVRLDNVEMNGATPEWVCPY